MFTSTSPVRDVAGHTLPAAGTWDIDPGHTVTIDMSTVESGNTIRDEHLKSAELFDVKKHPEARFHSTGVDSDGANGTIHGALTLQGTTRPVPLDVTFDGYARDPWGGHRAFFCARTTINREDFGITWNMAVETGGLLVSKDVRIEISLEKVLNL